MAVQNYINDLIDKCYPGASIEVEFIGEDGAICWLYNVPGDWESYPKCANALEYLRQTLPGEVLLIDAEVEGLAAIETLWALYYARNERSAIVVENPDEALMQDEQFALALHEIATQGTDVLVLVH